MSQPMSETARCLGLPGSLEWQGQTLLVSRVTLGIEARFECWFVADCRAGLERQRDFLDRETMAAAEDQLGRDVREGLYAYSSERGRLAANAKVGFRSCLICASKRISRNGAEPTTRPCWTTRPSAGNWPRPYAWQRRHGRAGFAPRPE